MLGRVIGRKGRTISAIRTIVYSVQLKTKKVRIVIDENKKAGHGLAFLQGAGYEGFNV